MAVQHTYEGYASDWADLRTSAEMEAELFYTEQFVRMAKKELWGYVRQRSWSAEDCARVDEIQQYLRQAERWIAELREELGLVREDIERS